MLIDTTLFLSFQSMILVLFCFCLTLLTRIFRTMINKNGDRKYLCLNTDLREKESQLLPLSIMHSVKLLVNAFLVMFPHFKSQINGFLVLLHVFLASIEMTIWILFNSDDVLNYIKKNILSHLYSIRCYSFSLSYLC